MLREKEGFIKYIKTLHSPELVSMCNFISKTLLTLLFHLHYYKLLFVQPTYKPSHSITCSFRILVSYFYILHFHLTAIFC